MARKHLNEQTLRVEYQNLAGELEKLREEAQFILKRALEHSEIKYHSITARVKSYDSILGKAQRKRIHDPLNKLNDLVGVRVVCLFLDDIERIVSLVKDCFDVAEVDNKIDTGDVSSFGYMSVHLIAKMKIQFSGAPYFASVGRPFEVQVRTVAMEAWATISHYLDYKSDVDIPAGLRRDFYALSGTFYVADKHFQMFYSSSLKSQVRMDRLAEANSDALLGQDVNADSLRAYLRKKFSDREHMGPLSVSDLVEQLVASGYKTIGDVDVALLKGERAFSELEKNDAKEETISGPCPLDDAEGRTDEPSPPIPRQHYADVGALRVTINLVDAHFSELEKGHEGEPNTPETQEYWKSERERYRDFLTT